MMKKQKQIWVHPAFKKKLKLQAASEDMSILQLTKKLAKDNETTEEKIRKKFIFKL